MTLAAMRAMLLRSCAYSAHLYLDYTISANNAMRIRS